MLGKFLSNVLNSIAPNSSKDFKIILEKMDTVIINKLLFYPSAGWDFSDILLANGIKFNGLNFEFPNIYIHSDGGFYNESFRGYRESRSRTLLYTSFRRNQYDDFIKLNDERVIRVSCFERTNLQSEFWLIEFHGFINEEIIKQMISSNLQINLLYNKCDTLFGGMGNSWDGVPPAFYWFLFPELNIEYSISEYPMERFNEEILQFEKNGKWKSHIDRHFPDRNIDIHSLKDQLKSISYQHQVMNFGTLWSTDKDFFHLYKYFKD